MIKWFCLPELLSLFFLVLIYVYYHEKNAVLTFRRRVFHWIFRLSIFSMALDLLCANLLARPAVVPQWVNEGLNELYFILIVINESVIALYVYDLLCEHGRRKRDYRLAVGSLVGFNAGFAAVALTNSLTGALFSFSKDGHYTRGPLNKLGYAVMVAELAIALAFYMRNRAMLPGRVSHVIWTLPPVALLLGGLQFLYPEVLLNGTILTSAVFVLYSNFQTCRVEQDSLTKLGNRPALFEDISLKVRRGFRFQVVAVTFKTLGEINCQMGHNAGDELLVHVAEWVASLPHCTAYRFSNITFAAVFPFRGAGEASENFELFRTRFGKPWRFGGTELTLSVVVCEIIWDGRELEPSTLVEYLDAMARPSSASGSEWIRFNSLAAARMERRQRLESVLRQSVHDDRFTVAMQPMYHCKDGTFASAEVLARLCDYEGTQLPAGEFIPLAEQTGLIEDIDWSVLEKACAFCASHRDLPPVSFSINVSVQQFLDARFSTRVCECLERYHLPPSRLKLEITERVISQDLEKVGRMMAALSEKGIGFYLDDFGVGYSNFSMLLRLPFESVKIDRSLIAGIPDSPENRLMVRSLISLFHSCGFTVICEGVETAEQCRVVEELGADCIQGFYYASPMEPRAFSAFLWQAPARPAVPAAVRAEN